MVNEEDDFSEKDFFSSFLNKSKEAKTNNIFLLCCLTDKNNEIESTTTNKTKETREKPRIYDANNDSFCLLLSNFSSLSFSLFPR
jgi:hypothetical protein